MPARPRGRGRASLSRRARRRAAAVPRGRAGAPPGPGAHHGVAVADVGDVVHAVEVAAALVVEQLRPAASDHVDWPRVVQRRVWAIAAAADLQQRGFRRLGLLQRLQGGRRGSEGLRLGAGGVERSRAAARRWWLWHGAEPAL